MAEFTPITDKGLAKRAAQPRTVVASTAKYDAKAQGIAIRLTNGVEATFPLAMLPGLEAATPSDLRKIVVQGRGYGLHTPALDADISVPQLFADHLGSTLMLKALRRTQASRLNGGLAGGREKQSRQPNAARSRQAPSCL